MDSEKTENLTPAPETIDRTLTDVPRSTDAQGAGSPIGTASAARLKSVSASQEPAFPDKHIELWLAEAAHRSDTR